MLPNLSIKLQNGALNRVAQSSDGVAGLILAGAGVEGKLELNKAYQLASTRDLTTLGITEENNPLVYKDVTAFYTKAGDRAELHLLVVSAATTLSQMCAVADDSPVRKLITSANGRIRLLGCNRLPADGYQASTDDTGIDADAVAAGESLQSLAGTFQSKIMPFGAILPGLLWNGTTDKLFKPREATYNGVQYTLAADAMIGETASAAVGLLLGTYASIPVYYNPGRPKNGVAIATGMLTDGKTPEEHDAILDALHDAGYVIFRTFPGRNGYYFSDDPMAAPLSDDYSNMSLLRVINKAIVLAYNAYIDEILDSVAVDENGYIPQPTCIYYQRLLETAVRTQMGDEISDFRVFIDPEQNLLSSSEMVVSCKIVPTATIRKITVNLGFENPALKQ